MIQLEDQFAKALSEIDSNSTVKIHMAHGKEISFAHTDLIYVGAESLKIIKRLNHQKRSRIRVVPYNKIEYITYSIDESTYNIYVDKATQTTGDDIPNIDDVNPNDVTTGDAEITVTSNNNPVSNVLVTLTRDELEYTGTTDDNGQASITGIIYGEYNVSITGEGYVNFTDTLNINAASVSETYSVEPVSNDPQEPIVEDPTSEETGDVQVTVTNNSNNLISGATIKLSKDETEYTETTDATGQITFEGIPYGTYTLEITAEGYTPLTEEITVNTQNTIESYTLNIQYTVSTPTLEEEEGEW